MKSPALLSFADLLPELSGFDTIIDARSPSEFALDHLPGAENFPVLDDEERIKVGTIYKQIGAFEAKKLGAALVSRNIGQHLENAWQNKSKQWRPLIYCWRGGNRSGALAHVLAKVGWQVTMLEGGYKAYRQYVNESLPQLAQALSIQVVCGTTGSGKSRLLQSLAAHGAQVLDLEALAKHRGSVLGHLPSDVQPSQKAFESAIWQQLRTFSPLHPVYIEAESKKVGNLRVPDILMERMRHSPCVVVELAKEARVRLLLEDYAHFVARPQLLIQQLDFLRAQHSNEQILRWQELALQHAFPLLVQQLLEQHYDPAYMRSMFRNFLQYTASQTVLLEDITIADFTQAAQQLLQTKSDD